MLPLQLCLSMASCLLLPGKNVSCVKNTPRGNSRCCRAAIALNMFYGSGLEYLVLNI